MMKRLRRRIMIERRRAYGFYAAFRMRCVRDLWAALQAYLKESKSTGCNMSDYWVLYRTIRRARPLEILECGTGVSTLVIAHALKENEKETGKAGRVTSMDEYEEWLEMSRRLLPEAYRPYVDFCLSGTKEESFSLFRGMAYAQVPDRAYDFVFVDGPKYIAPDGQPTFDFDFLNIVRRSEKPVGCLIDKRVSTCFVLQQLLGDKFAYDPVLHLGKSAGVCRADLGGITAALSSENFEDSFRALTRTRLFMTPLKG